MMYNAMTPCVNYVGPKAENAPFVILRKLSREVMTIRNQPDNVMGVKNVENALTI